MPRVLIAIPAFNEAQHIGACVTAALTSARKAGLEPVLVVANDASTDATADLARNAGAIVVDVECRQIAAVRNAAARAVLHLPGAPPPAPDDVLVFIDGDTLISVPLLKEACEALNDGFVGGGARVRFDEGTPRWATIFFLTLAGPLLYWRGYAGGCFLYCRRDAFEASGGFDEAYFAAEELHFLKALKRLRRGKVRILKNASITSGRKVRQYSPWRLVRTLLTMLRTGARKRDGLDLWYSGEREETTEKTLESP